MSLFGNYLSEQRDASGLSNAEFAARLGIGDAHLSDFIKGKRKSANPETLNKMVAGISDDRKIQAGLLEAFLRDQVNPDARAWVRVEPGGSRAREESEAYGKKDDPPAQLADNLRRHAISTGTIQDLMVIADYLPGRSSLHDLVHELAEFSKDAIDGKKAKKLRAA